MEVFVSHRNARLTVHGRRLLVQRVRELGMPVAHAAKAMDEPTVTNLTAGCCTGVGQEITVDVLANDDCTGCTVDVLEGSASVVAGGLFIDPADGFVGTLTLRYRVTDPATGRTSEAPVQGANRIPICPRFQGPPGKGAPRTPPSPPHQS
jgi:hypothetical protein